MKKILGLLLAIAIVITNVQLSGAKRKSLIQGKSAYQIIKLFVKSSFCYDIKDIKAYTRKSDPNKMLGRPGYYISKAECYDYSIDQEDQIEPVGINVETFRNATQAKKRYKYLKNFQDPSLGAFGVNEYLILDKKVLFRFTYEYSGKEMKTFKKAIASYEKGKMYYAV